MDPIIGQIILIGFNWAPQGWALCNGQLLPISQYNALFSLIGTTYGGDGRTTFALPDLRGRVPVHQGNGPGLTPRVMGEASGTEAVTLTLPEIPMHTHTATVSAQPASRGGTVLAASGLLNTGPSDLVLAPTTISPAGGSMPHQNMQPYLVMNYIIALEGIYPTRP